MSKDNLRPNAASITTLNFASSAGTKDDDQKSHDNTKNGEDKSEKEEKHPAAKALVELAKSRCEFFHDERAEGYALVSDGDIKRTLKLRSKLFRTWLVGTFYREMGNVANNEALSTALAIFEARATYDSAQRELFNRFAMIDEAIYIDIADPKWRAIKITADGWEIVEKPPVLFRRYSHQQPLPDPVKGGKLSDIHQHLGIKLKDDKLLLEAYLVACAFSDVPRPAITFHGPQGASKTTTARCLKALTDPSVLVSVDLGKSPGDLAQILDHHGVPCFDNLSSIPHWAADMLCRGVTGGAFSKRELYSDDSDIILSFKRAIIITGINIPTHAPDLLDRLLLIGLERIPPRKRLDETTFWKSFNQAKPKLFGGLLDAIAGTLQRLPNTKPSQMGRMADFTLIACAYAEYAGIGAKKMLAIIMRHTARQTEEVLAADPVASAIVDFIKKKKEAWSGTPTKLLKLLNENVPAPRPFDWPRQPNSLTRKMNILRSTLDEAGVRFKMDKGRKSGRKLTLEYKAKSPSPSSTSSKPLTGKGVAGDGKRKQLTNRPTEARDQGAVKHISSSLPSSSDGSIGAPVDGVDDEDDKKRILPGSQ